MARRSICVGQAETMWRAKTGVLRSAYDPGFSSGMIWLFVTLSMILYDRCCTIGFHVSLTSNKQE